MAYDLKYLSRMQQTLNLDKSLNPQAGMDSLVRPQMWAFDAGANGANDTKAATVAADYFLSAYGFVSEGDLVYVFANDGAQMLSVTASTSSTVTSSALSSI